MNGLRIALPAGTLFESACTLLQQAGIARLDPGRFDRELSIPEGDNVYVKVRPTDVPVYVEMGACECGIVGKDVLWESSRECYELADLGFGQCRLVLAAPRESALGHGVWPQSLRVATKYPVSAHALLRRALTERGAHPPARIGGARATHRSRRLRARHHRDGADAGCQQSGRDRGGWSIDCSPDRQPCGPEDAQ